MNKTSREFKAGHPVLLPWGDALRLRSLAMESMSMVPEGSRCSEAGCRCDACTLARSVLRLISAKRQVAGKSRRKRGRK